MNPSSEGVHAPVVLSLEPKGSPSLAFPGGRRFIQRPHAGA